MTAKDLKNALLQEAVQGKLVPQITSEGNAKDLLEEIRKERGESDVLFSDKSKSKTKLVSEASLPLATARKRSSATPSAGTPRNAPMEISEDEVPFDIPENWCWCRLWEIINIKSGDGLTASQMKKGSIPVFGGNGITGYHNTANIHKETIVIGRVGFYCGSVHVTPKEAWVTDNAFITTYPENQINRNFLVHILRHLNLGQDNNATAQPVVSGKKIYPMLFPLPPLAEQKRIVAAIEKFMPLIEEYGKKETVLNELNAQIGTLTKKAILQEAVQGKLVPQNPAEGNAKDLLEQIKAQKAALIKEGKIKKEKDVTPIELDEKELPKGWTYIKLGEISSIITKQTGFDYSASIKPNLSEICLPNMIPMVQTKNFKGKSFELNTDYYISKDIAEKFPKILLDSKCMLLSIVGASIGNVGIYDNPTLAMIGGAICKVKLLDDRFYDYLFYFLQSKSGQDEIYKNFKSTAQGTITVQDVREITIPMPPLSEQKRIVAAIEQLLPLCDN